MTVASTRPQSSLLVGAIIATAVAAGWVLLAFANPGTNYHFAPLAVTVTPVLVARFASSTRLSGRTTLVAVIGGVFATTLGALMLLALVAFDGPTLAPGLSPEGEALIMTSMGVAIGVLIGRAGQRANP
jgi:peptidoglycan/LPS O-acetylase OafA/YrhL